MVTNTQTMSNHCGFEEYLLSLNRNSELITPWHYCWFVIESDFLLVPLNRYIVYLDVVAFWNRTNCFFAIEGGHSGGMKS
jgi:hypothetical protein